MKALSPLVVLSLLCPALTAQPVIDLQNLPQTGDVVTIGRCSDLIDDAALDASAGAMQTWDFSGLSEFSEEQFVFVDPATTPWTADNPNSNLCGISWDDAYTYYILSASSLEQEGNAIVIPGTPPEDTAKFLFNGDTERIIELPYTFGDAFTDDFSGTYSAMGFVGTFDGQIDLEVDGYGTLILPNATYPNTVRYHFDRTQNNTIFGNTNQTSKEQWAWVSADHRFWLLLMEINDDGFGTSQQVWYDKNPALAGPTAVADAASTEPSVFPVPVEAGSDAYVRGLADGQRIDLLDATGRIIRKLPYGSTIIPTEGLAPAIYLLRSSDRNGRTVGTSRLIVR
ncbi:MAG: T9SS type A sorting domain-containing protein [Flavobacteriales bacterium]